ncbi:MAG: NAD(P)H-dependent oxidoreductase [Bacteroidales bacterium]|nr:NAD(P)H-dependent oxidoreductase [Bacteroidales bacterium]
MKHILFTLVLFIMTAMVANSQNTKVLVVYYSWGGNTRVVAEKIKAQLGADLVKIVPETAYPTDYSECVAQARKETKENFRPAIKTKIDNLSDYDVILVGTPNWCSTIAPPVATFLSENNFEGKKVALFVTHGGGGLSRCESDMRKLSENAKFLKSGVFSGSSVASSDDDIAKWLKEIDLKK